MARSKRAKCIEKVARPWLRERSSVEYPNILESGTRASTTLARGFGVMPSILRFAGRQAVDDAAQKFLGHDDLHGHDGF